MPDTSLLIIPTADVTSHKTSKSCYVTAGARVYDVTAFLDSHPGGADLILEYGGKDVSGIMKDETSHSHSDAAYDIFNESLIGLTPTQPALKSVAYHGEVDDIVSIPPNNSEDQTINKNEAAKSDIATEPIFQTTGLKGLEDLAKEATNDAKPRKKKFLDLDKPLLMQLWRGNFSKDFYLEQVHMAHFYNADGSAPLFGNFLEPLSKTAWWVVPLVWYPWVAYGTWKANTGMASPWMTGGYWMIGLALWTLVEYGLHRGLFHVDKYLPDNRVGITGHFLLHGIHHYLPMDKLRLVMPPALFLILATPFWKLAQTVFYWDWYAATAVFCGGIFGYVCYDMTHYFLHHKQLPSYYRRLKKYHLQHHYGDHENGFGVTSRFWDVVFGTELGDVPSQAAKAA